MKYIFLRGLTVIFAVMLLSWQFIFGQSSVSNDDCLSCHEDYDASLNNSSHQLISEKSNSLTAINCFSCHSGGQIHIEDPSEDNISNPANLDAEKESLLCRSCHTAHVELDNYGNDIHQDLEFNCSSCHTIHSHDGKRVELSDNTTCFSCHESKISDFSKRSNHPLIQGNLTCLSCHKFTRRMDNAIAYDVDRVCQDCHQEQSGPFLYEHDAVNAYAVEGSGCISCHNPHGSENDRLLKQPGNTLCQQCHMTPPEHETRHGGLANNRSCQSCHSGLHGSMLSSHFLDPDMFAKIAIGPDCYTSGCHVLNR